MRPSGSTPVDIGAQALRPAGEPAGEPAGPEAWQEDAQQAGRVTRPQARAGAGARRTLQWCGAFLGLGAAGMAIGWQMGDRRPRDQRPLSR